MECIFAFYFNFIHRSRQTHITAKTLNMLRYDFPQIRNYFLKTRRKKENIEYHFMYDFRYYTKQRTFTAVFSIPCPLLNFPTLKSLLLYLIHLVLKDISTYLQSVKIK